MGSLLLGRKGVTKEHYQCHKVVESSLDPNLGPKKFKIGKLEFFSDSELKEWKLYF